MWGVAVPDLVGPVLVPVVDPISSAQFRSLLFYFGCALTIS